MDENSALVNVIGLEKRFTVSAGVFGRVKGQIHAVDDISFEIQSGRSLGLVGESGCGKTTTGKLLARLMDPTGGHIYLNDELMGRIDLAEIRGKELKTFRQRVQIIFQDPYESLNPRRTIYDTVEEPLRVQGTGILVEREARVVKQLELVGLTPASSLLFRFPYELSGSQQQRVAIAHALVVNPVFMVADEPTSVLDVSIRIGVMQLIMPYHTGPPPVYAARTVNCTSTSGNSLGDEKNDTASSKIRGRVLNLRPPPRFPQKKSCLNRRLGRELP
jgi:peptide/nickel transport system ATP-binding protein